MTTPNKSIRDLIIEYYQTHPNEDIKHGPVVDYVEHEYLKLTGKKPRDTWRAVRALHQNGFLIKVKKGVYRYDPNYVHEVELFDFDAETKEEIFTRDNYRCVVCGRGRENGVEITADHKKPKDKGGDNSVDNGQTLCTEHNLLKHNYSRTEAGKRYFIQLYEDAIKNNDDPMIAFCEDVFDVYDKHQIDTHIKKPDNPQRKLFR